VNKRKKIEALVLQGKTNKQIVKILGVDVRYVYNVRSMLRKRQPKKYTNILEKHEALHEALREQTQEVKPTPQKLSWWMRVLNLFKG